VRNIVVIVVLLALLGGASYFLLRNSSSTPTATPTTTTGVSPTMEANPTSTTSAFCTPSQLQATTQTEVAAGNAYVQIMLKNNSSTSCQVIGNNTLSVGYPNSVTNFTIVSKKQPTTPTFTLTPNQTIYALVHFPNGPQCSSQATDVNSMVSYEVSEKDSVSFKPTMGDTLLIPSCGKATEVTQIDLYSFSTSPVTP
jgi:hypothetical protein